MQGALRSSLARFAVVTLAALVGGCRRDGASGSGARGDAGAGQGEAMASTPGAGTDQTSTVVDSADADGPVLEADVTVKTAADLAVLRGVTVLRGGLTVVRSDLATLEGLESLRRIEGTLLVAENPQLTALRGLGGLVSVAGDLEVRENVALADVDGLLALERVGGTLTVGSAQQGAWDAREGRVVLSPAASNDVLGSLRLPALRSVGNLVVSRNPALEILDLPSLVAVPGDVELTYLPRLQSLGAFGAGLTSVGGRLRIGRAKAQVPVPGEGAARKAVGVPVFGNDVLREIHLPKLAAVGSLDLLGETSAPAGVSLPALALVAGGVSLNGGLAGVVAPALRRIKGTVQVGPAAYFYAAPSSVGGDVRMEGTLPFGFFQGLEVIEGELELALDEREDLRPLGRLRRLGGLWINSLGAQTLMGLEGLEEVARDLHITYAPNLTDVSALRKLRRVGGELYIGTEVLEDLDLPALTSVGVLNVFIASSLRRVRAPLLERALALSIDLPVSSLEVLAFPKLTEVDASVYLRGAQKLDGFPVLRRIGTNLTLASDVLTRAELQAFVDEVRARGSIGGKVTLEPADEAP